MSTVKHPDLPGRLCPDTCGDPDTASVDTQVRLKTRALLANDQTRAAFAAYLDGLEVDGYARDPAMAEFVAAARRQIAENDRQAGGADA